MGYKVTKKYGAYAVVKDEYWDDYYIVDVEQGLSLYKTWSAKHAKMYADKLEKGVMAAGDLEGKYNSAYMMPIEMPKSLQAQQVKLKKQAAAEAAGLAKPIGSHAPSIVSVVDKGTYKLLEMSDGTFGYLVPSTGQSKLNLANKQYTMQTAKKAASKHAEGILQAQGVDIGSNATDTLISLYEARARELYGRAAAEMGEKSKKFLEKYAKANEEMSAKYASGEITYEELKKWRAAQSAIIARNQQMTDMLASDLVNADQRAMAMLNGYMGPCYSENLAYETFRIEAATGNHDISTSFSIYNQDAVNGILQNPDSPLLPPRTNVPQDMAWSRQKISSSIAQSILTGESVPDAAERLASVVGMSANTAVRAARTALTGAQNYGRLVAGQRAKAMGIELKKQWVATHDDRTRDSHREIDQETVELDDDFSNGCEYPGDPSGGPEEVYNCRCAMRYVIPGHEYDDLPDTVDGMSYEEWKVAKKPNLEAKKEKIQQELDALEAQKGQLLGTLQENQTYAANELFKHPTSLDKWEQEQASIADSKAYCQKKLDELEKQKDADGNFPTQALADKYDHYEIKYDNIDIYDMLGKEYHEAQEAVQSQLDAIEARRKELGADMQKLVSKDGSAYTQERLDAARKFQTRGEADDALRSISGRAWQEATQDEKRAIHTYTGGDYEDYNMPLNGYDGSYTNFVGLDMVSIGNNGYAEEIRAMTRMIEKSVTEEDMWLRRGVGARTMSGFFGFEPTSRITDHSLEELQKLIGTSNRIGSFQSCGTTMDTGFTSEPVVLEIFVPQGSEAMYVEPISMCGSGAGLRWDGVSPQKRFSSELETIIQRGGSYTCRDVRYDYEGKLVFQLELHPEDGYWKFQQD